MCPDSPHNLASSYGMGYKLLKQMGFSQGDGIGKKQGIAVPLSHGDLRPKQAGLGYFKEETNVSILEQEKDASLFDIASQKNKKVHSAKEHDGMHKRKTGHIIKETDSTLAKTELLSSLSTLGNAREIMLSPEKTEQHVGASPRSNLKKLLEIEERRLSLIQIEHDSIEIQIPIYEALNELTHSLSLAIVAIKEEIKKQHVEPHTWIQDILQSLVIEKIRLFYSKMEEKNQVATTSRLDDKVSGELHRSINEVENKVAEVLSATNNMLISLLIPLHRRGSLLELDSYFPAEFTRQLLPSYGHLEGLIEDRISSPSLFQSLLMGLLLPAIKKHIRTATHPDAYDPVIWWLEKLPTEVVEVVMGSVIIPHLGGATFDIIAEENILPWLPFFNTEKLLFSLGNHLLSTSFSSEQQLEAVFSILRSIDRIPIQVENLLAERLSAFLLKSFKINPEEQELGVLEAVIGASDILPLEVMARVLAKGLFPLLVSYAAAWMRSATMEDLKTTSLADDISAWF